MTYLNGGYSIIKKDDANIFAKVNDALTNGKPILFYEDDKNCYYIDTMEKTGTDSITLTKGGKTILITSGNVVTESGEEQQHLYYVSIDGGDLTIDGGSMSGVSPYITFLSPIRATNLSDLPDGFYVVTSGELLDGDSNQLSIRDLHIYNGVYEFETGDDDSYVFTFTSVGIAPEKIF